MADFPAYNISLRASYPSFSSPSCTQITKAFAEKQAQRAASFESEPITLSVAATLLIIFRFASDHDEFGLV
jgi:hypothetical protein